jgi:hypothetical protein
MENKTCETCGSLCADPNKKFCSEICYNNQKSKDQVALVCGWCQKEYKTSKSRSPASRYCSRDCLKLEALNSEQRVCIDCKTAKSIDQFYKHNKNKNTRRRYCLDCERNRNYLRSRTTKERWMSSQRRTKKSGKAWEIGLDDFQQLISSPCHYCGGPLDETGCGLDRKDNSLGYIGSNIVPCCGICNIVKNDHFSYTDMMLLSPNLTLIRSQKNSYGK